MKDLSKNFSEKFLYHIWDGGHLRLDKLKTTEKHKVEILFRGRWNMDSGPDFKGALIKIDGELKKGDVEIHTNDQDWFFHKHNHDERYNGVILHAVLSIRKKSRPCQTKDGNIVPTVIMGDYFDESVSRLQTRVNSSFDQPKKNWPEVCPLNLKPEMQIKKILEHWGLERLRLKKERFLEERDFFQFNELLYQGFCEALGYSKNREPFLKMSLLVPINIVWDVLNRCSGNKPETLLQIQGLFFGASGLLTQSEQNLQSLPVEVTQFIQRLKFYWSNINENYSLGEMKSVEWQFFRLRPMNFPTIRIAGLCKLILSHHQQGLLEPILELFRDLKHSPQKIFACLQHQFEIKSFGFWRNHFHLGEPVSSLVHKDFKIIGKSKAREIVVNVVLPVVTAYAEESENLELLDLVNLVYLSSPVLDSNHLTKRLSQQLNFNGNNRSALKLTACHQQGMIHLAKMFCPRWYCQVCNQSIE